MKDYEQREHPPEGFVPGLWAGIILTLIGVFLWNFIPYAADILAHHITVSYH